MKGQGRIVMATTLDKPHRVNKGANDGTRENCGGILVRQTHTVGREAPFRLAV